MLRIGVGADASAFKLRTHLVHVTAKVAIGILAFNLLGCKSLYLAPPSTVYPCLLPSNLPVGKLPLTGNLYHAYGESITYGFLLPTNLDAYPYLVASDLSLTGDDLAINGAQACDLSPSEIFPANDNPSNANAMLYMVMIGTNNAGRNTLDSPRSLISAIRAPSLGWLCPLSRKPAQQPPP